MQRVLSFAHRRVCTRKTIPGRVVGLDVTISMVRAIRDTNETVYAALDTQDCSESLYEVVSCASDTVHIECDLEQDDDGVWRIARLHLAVDPTRLNLHLREGSLIGEEHIVGLARNVWREATVPRNIITSRNAEPIPECAVWRSQWQLFEHQEASIRWMREVEARVPETLRYAGNLRMTDEWYLDTESECFTTDPSWRDATLCGGICADGTGMGKTATMLRLITTPCEMSLVQSSMERYTSQGTLVILPLNLVSQWQHELQKFIDDTAGLQVVWLVQGKDLRTVTMEDLCKANIVFTTFHFLRASKPYCELVESALGGRARTRPVLSSWARQWGHTEAVVEAVAWRRVVVDELHQVFESARELRHLRLINTHVTWGMTATPTLDTEHAQNLYLFLRREKAHHPNLLCSLIERAVHGTESSHEHPEHTLQLVQASAEERLHLMREDANVEEIVKLTTFVDVSDGERVVADSESIEAQFRAAREREMATLRAKVAGHDRAVAILERASVELDAELQLLAEQCANGDEFASAQAEAARGTAETHARDLARARELRSHDAAKLERCEASARFVHDRLTALRAREEVCVICMERTSSAITPCAHIFCSQCIHRHLAQKAWCPTCRNPLQSQDLTGVTLDGGIGTKMVHIKNLIGSLPDEPLILFVQWKAMMRGMRAYLRGVGARVLVLDGNTVQRASTLSEFARGGVLLLCLEDSFAGLHLPHARYVIFAHAIVADRARVEHLERQAVARCVRTGQTREVKVYSFVIADCVEEHVWRRTHS